MKNYLLPLLTVLLLAACNKETPEFSPSNIETVRAGEVPASAVYVPYSPAIALDYNDAAYKGTFSISKDRSPDFILQATKDWSFDLDSMSRAVSLQTLHAGVQIGIVQHLTTDYYSFESDTIVYVGSGSNIETEITNTTNAGNFQISADQRAVKSYFVSGPVMLEAGTEIGEDSPWLWGSGGMLRASSGQRAESTSPGSEPNTTIYNIRYTGSRQSYWAKDQRGYAPIRLLVDGVWKYGWIELEVQQSDAVTLYARVLQQ